MKKNNEIVSIIVFFVFTLFINSKTFAQSLTVQNGFVRATIPGTNISSAYMTIKNLDENSVTLVGVSSNISPQIEIHQHLMLDGMMKMRKKASIIINGKDTVMLQPSGLHFMIFDLSKPLIDGEEVTLTLHFSKYPDVVVALPVQSIKKKQHHH